MFAHLLIEPTPPKYFLTCSNIFYFFLRFISAPMEYTMLTLNPNLPKKNKNKKTKTKNLDLKRIEKEDSPSL
jgi:hypothetical protein